MDTLAELEQVMRDTGTRGVTVVFGRSAAPGKRHQFFASTGSHTDQVYGDTLAEALGKLFGEEIVAHCLDLCPEHRVVQEEQEQRSCEIEITLSPDDEDILI